MRQLDFQCAFTENLAEYTSAFRWLTILASESDVRNMRLWAELSVATILQGACVGL